MTRLSPSISITAALLAFAFPGIYAGAVAQDRSFTGDTLLVERVQEEPANLPRRGMNMSQVEARFGVPRQRLEPRGGQKRVWPTINRWMYPGFTVYFERTKVIDVVLNKADVYEIGPKPPTT
ncbi:MAG: hypothetical protein M3R16_08565 [Pseudomonadota bacterium]|nr:hypothetical protein [Pseudomonadota bacterium]